MTVATVARTTGDSRCPNRSGSCRRRHPNVSALLASERGDVEVAPRAA